MKIAVAGTGYVGLSLAVLLSQKHEVTAVDISADALALAKENAEANGADVLFIQSDMFTRIRGRFDLIITNPPYIPTATARISRSRPLCFPITISRSPASVSWTVRYTWCVCSTTWTHLASAIARSRAQRSRWSLASTRSRRCFTRTAA